MQAKEEHVSLTDVVKEVIPQVRRRLYLGSPNQDNDPTGGLGGYYLNVCRQLFDSMTDSPAEELAFNFLIVDLIGAGNCGELTSALYAEVYRQFYLPRIKAETITDETVEAEERIGFGAHAINGPQKRHGYFVADKRVYDIWGNTEYSIDELEQQTGVPRGNHSIRTIAWTNWSSYENCIYQYKNQIPTRFRETLEAHQKQNVMYFTLEVDEDAFAISAYKAFPYLFTKLMEALASSELDIQDKIINDFRFLIEGLKRDYPLNKGAQKHPKQKKYSPEEISRALNALIPDHPLFTDFVLALGDQKYNPEAADHRLEKLLARPGLKDPINSSLEDLIKRKAEAIREELKKVLEPLYDCRFFPRKDASILDKKEPSNPEVIALRDSREHSFFDNDDALHKPDPQNPQPIKLASQSEKGPSFFYACKLVVAVALGYSGPATGNFNSSPF